jgi:hypothetical protein
MKKLEEIILRLEKIEQQIITTSDDIENLKKFKDGLISFIIGIVIVVLFFIR